MSEQINLRIPTGLLEEIDAMADAVGENRSEFLRTAAAERMGYLRRERGDEAIENGNSPSSAPAASYPALQWRETPPLETGWYWLDDDQGPTFSPRVVGVEPSYADEDAELQYIVDDPMDPQGVRKTFSDYEDARWSGPIPEPSEA